MQLTQQLGAILKKNLLIRWRRFGGFMLEIWLPVLFLCLLILIKGLTDIYDSPTIDYSCGQVDPWNYAASNASWSTLATCAQEPDTCSAKHYYRKQKTLVDEQGNATTLYKSLGYVDADDSFPFYTLTVSDSSSALNYPFRNPSLDFPTIVSRLFHNRAIFGIAPKHDDDVDTVTATEELANYLKELAGNSTSDDVDVDSTIVLFESQHKMNSYMTDRHYEDDDYKMGKVGMAIVVNHAMPIASTNQDDPVQWDYSIRMNYTYNYEQKDDQVSCLYPDGKDCDFTYTIPPTQFYTFDLTKPQTMDYIYGYSFSGFSTVQKVVDEYILGQSQVRQGIASSSSDPFKLLTSLSLMPTDHFKTDTFQFVISSTLPLFYMLSFLYPVSRIIKGVVEDKENKIKEGLKMMGLTDLAYNLSWLITLTLQMALTSALIVLITGPSIFEHSDKGLVFLYFMAFSMAIMMFCFLISTLFDKAKSASLLGTLIFFATYFPYYSVASSQMSVGTKVSSCLLAPTCFALGANVFADWEGGLVGVQSDNTSTLTSNFSYTLTVVMLFVDALLYGLLALYFDLVLPSEYGTQLSPYFFLLPSFWKQCFGLDQAEEGSGMTENLLAGEELTSEYDHEHGENPDVEEIGEDLKAQLRNHKGVKIRKLRKVFPTTGDEDRVAVNSLNLDMFEGQVTCLLGHNGAGKSTTISMLTGLIPPTSGDAEVLGYSISRQMREIRKFIGVCPQHDVLFPTLTVREHLRMFAKVKGVPDSEVEAEVDQMVREVGLKEKIDVMSSMLSGGMKRKLSVGIAMIGGSKVVILDEPTSGMDPFSRRSTWNVIQKMKQGRIILLTTHFLDEADILGDRIAIMGEGKLKCVGSSMFLKAQYGVGYTLTVAKSGDAVVDKDMEHQAMNIGGEVTSSIGTELYIRLPFGASKHFPELFSQLDDHGMEFGISVTTLEEVFLRVGRGTDGEMNDAAARESIARLSSARSIHSNDQLEVAEEKEVNLSENQKFDISMHDETKDTVPLHSAFYSSDRGREMERLVFWVHLKALLRKRMLYGLRDRKVFLCQLVLPFLLVLLGLVLLLIAPNTDQPSISLTEDVPKNQNPDLGLHHRNYVPFTSVSSLAEEVGSYFHFDATAVYAEVLNVQTDELSGSDPFDGCSQQTPSQSKNMTGYLVTTNDKSLNFNDIDEKGSSRYGAIVAGGNESAFISQHFINGSSVHGAGAYPNLISNSLIKVMSNNPDSYIKLSNHPLPRTNSQDNTKQTADGFTAAVFIMIAMCFLPASYAAFIVKEREVKAKHQQIISGVSLTAYWSATFLWDAASYLVPCSLILGLIFAFQIDSFTKNEGAGAVVILFLLYGPAVASFTYIISFFFKNHSTAQNSTLFLHFLTGLCLMITSFVLTLVDSTTEANNSLRYFYRLFPTYCLGDGLSQIAVCEEGKHCPKLTGDGYSSTETVSPFEFNTAGGNIIYLAIESVLYFLITILIEYLQSFPAILSFLHPVNDPGTMPHNVDDDVLAEEVRVMSEASADDVVRLMKLRKVYSTPIGPKVAVQTLTFGVPRGECFGFLGINGAGKTTTLSILSGEFPPTSGTAKIAGFDVLKDQTKLRRRIGYCPQFDALLELLTVREHLELYARIKGIHPSIREQTIEYLIDHLSLRDFHDKNAGSLSGGNKRKLSVAISMIGDPSIIFLDEPSTGMDPISRRKMWEVINGLLNTTHREAGDEENMVKTAIILTTHSMEECEALCGRIGIMVNGSLKCLGSATRLKNKFGSGFELDIKLNGPTHEEIYQFLTRHDPSFGGEEMKESIDMKLREKIQKDRVSYTCSLFQNVHRLKEISPTGAGGMIDHMISAEGGCEMGVFVEWWLLEDYFAALEAFMHDHFDDILLLERSTSTSFRYRITPAEGMSLSTLFSLFEEKKEELNIHHYSLGQTTLEQIFNSFASSQDNPENN